MYSDFETGSRPLRWPTSTARARRRRPFCTPIRPWAAKNCRCCSSCAPRPVSSPPLTKLARWPRPSPIETITVSISESDDVRKYGLSPEHFDTLTDEIHLYLLLAGLKIAYGGALQGSLSGTSNFTLRLFELVRTYSKLAEGVNAKPLKKAILNVAPWPLWLDYGDSEWKLFSGDIADYEQGPRPELPWSDDEVFPPGASARLLGSAGAPLRLGARPNRDARAHHRVVPSTISNRRRTEGEVWAGAGRGGGNLAVAQA